MPGSARGKSSALKITKFIRQESLKHSKGLSDEDQVLLKQYKALLIKKVDKTAKPNEIINLKVLREKMMDDDDLRCLC